MGGVNVDYKDTKHELADEECVRWPMGASSAHLHCEMTNTQPLPAKLKSLCEVTYFWVGDQKGLSLTFTENLETGV